MRLVRKRQAQLLVAAAGIALVAIAFLRGNYLLGLDCGVAYAAVTFGLLWLFAGPFYLTGRPSPARMLSVAIVSLALAFVMAYPASVNPDLQHFIDKRTTDRAARKELAAVFASDPAYGNLSVSTVHFKDVNVTIQGSLPDQSTLDRLRSRIAEECSFVNHCTLHWDVTFRDTAKRIEGLDNELFRAVR